MKRWLWLVLAALALTRATGPVSGAGLIILDERSWTSILPPQPPHRPPDLWPRPLPPPHRFAPLEVSYTRAHTRIHDQVAVTTIEEEFHNPNPTRLEGTFVFPVPKGAHLDKFTMEIDGRQVPAELVGADKARGIYEDIVRKLRDPALLEYAGQDLFKVRIFPIEPQSRKRISLSYTELLKSDNGLVTYLLPLNAGKFSAAPIRNVTVKVDLETQRPLKSIYSPTHNVEVKRHTATSATAGYEASETPGDTDFALYFAPEKDELGVNLLASKTGDQPGYFLLLASPGVDVKEKQVAHKDIAFVLDTSGSMAGPKLNQAKKALQFCVENLNDGDRFELIRFSTEVEPLFDKLVEANPANRTRAETFIKDLRPMGGTAIDDALKKALGLRPTPGAEAGEAAKGGRPFVVIFLTDGQPTIGTTDENEILDGVKRAGGGRTRVFCFGIGTDVNTHLLDRLTELTRGASQYVLPEEDLEIKVSNFFAKIKEPVLANPTLRFTGDIRATSLYPSTLPDLFKGEQLVLVGRYAGAGPSAVAIEGTVNGSSRKFTSEVTFPAESAENPFIARLWATRRVGYLLDEIRLHGENAELKDEVTSLARQYGIVTPYTAYLIVEDEARRDVPPPLRSLPALERDREAVNEVGASWHQFKFDHAGEAAVADARGGRALSAAAAPAVATADSTAAFSRRYGLASSAGRLAPGTPATTAPAPSGAQRAVQYAQQARFVAGKSFFQNGDVWVDALVQKTPAKAKPVRLLFASAEYFAFAQAHPKAAAWLALGRQVHFVLDKTVYEVYDTEK